MDDQNEPTEENTRPEGMPAPATDPNMPLTKDTSADPADLVTTRTADTPAKPIFEPVAAPAPLPSDSGVITDLGPSHVLNAAPGADPMIAPDVHSQRTGAPDDTVYRSPGMTRGSALNQLEVMYGELVNKLHDFDHDTSGLPADLVALVDFVKSRSGARAWAAQLNGANNMRVVRVTDGTDTAATASIGFPALAVTARYTGSLGNKVQVMIAAGSAANSWKVVISLPGLAPEVFDNLAAGLGGNAIWTAIAAAINAGSSALRGPSQLVTAAAGLSTTAPVAGSTILTGGTDGAATITGSVLLGQDSAPRKGMYALRSVGCAIAMLADCDDSTTYSAQAAFALSEGVYVLATTPAGDTIGNAATTKATAGIDLYGLKLLLGDWCYFLDTVNSQTRLISPQAFLAGRLSALSPERSGLNKPLAGIVGTQRSSSTGGVTVYSAAELQQLAQAGIDVIANPCPGGAYFGSRIGCNTSSNAVINQDSYPRLTNYIAATLNAGMGLYVGRLQSPSVRAQAAATLNAFLSGLWSAGQIGDVNDAKRQPFTIQLDASNNPASRVALGYMQADVRVTYLSVVTKLLINVEAGQSVSISVASSTPL